jgi:hypothetical protein
MSSVGWVPRFSNCKESSSAKGSDAEWNSRKGVFYFAKKNTKIKEGQNEEVKNEYFYYYLGFSAYGYSTFKCFFAGKADRTKACSHVSCNVSPTPAY